VDKVPPKPERRRWKKRWGGKPGGGGKPAAVKVGFETGKARVAETENTKKPGAPKAVWELKKKVPA